MMMVTTLGYIHLPLLCLVLSCLHVSTGSEDPGCYQEKIELDEFRHKRKYRIAVHAIRGFESAMLYYSQTFEDYLTATAGKRFDPPIEFELVPVSFNGLFEAVQEESVDFIYANPGSYSCIGVEQGAQPLVTTISEVQIRGHTYDLDVFGGVIFTRADNKEIQTIHDLKDKVIGAGAISVIMGGQTQLYEMVKAGMNYVMDPKQVVFTGNQFDVVAGVLNGDFDVGMVRTDQIERSLDADGNPLDPDVFRILEPKIHVLDDGTLFPFLHSTEIFPEWPVAALTFVPTDVSIEVQAALLAMSQHAEPWALMLQCLDDLEINGTTIEEDLGIECDAVFWNHLARCDTTADLAKLAYGASQAGGIAGFRSPRSYFDVRTMHERAGFMLQDLETGEWACTRADSLQDSLTCPPEHYKLSPAEFEKSCTRFGLSCKEGYDCYCKPCVKAFEVDVYQYFPSNESLSVSTSGEKLQGCTKMSLCGVMEQREMIYMRTVDNKKRPNATVTALIHLGHTTHDIPVQQVAEYMYELAWFEVELGVGVVEVYVNGEQIPESPFRVQVTPRSCHLADNGGGNRVPDDEGNCVCADGDIGIGGSCVTSTILAVSISLIALVAVSVGAYLVIQHKNHKNDLVWHVSADELKFDDPVEVIGEGAFGVVLLAEYRGTKVAIKRALKASSTGTWGRSLSGTPRQEANALDDEAMLQQLNHGDSNSGPISVDLDEEGETSGDSETPTTEGSINDLEAQRAVAAVSASFQGRGRARTSLSQSRSRSSQASKSPGKRGKRNSGVFKSKRSSVIMDLGFLDNLGGRRRRGKKAYATERFHEALSIGSAGSSRVSRTFKAKLCPWFDSQTQREAEFVAEMRLLSTLRHPCICTVMGAVVESNYVPMLVMEYMEYGSLHDLLRNETMYLSGEIILQIARDVAQGLLYLHSAKPPILHGDLKPANILIDSRFRAKVCDFGLSRKKKNTISGSLYWLAPEYLTGMDDYTTACDMYSIGVILNETYSRQKPYAGEDADLKTLLLEVCDRRVNKRPVMSETMPTRMAELVKRLWSRDVNTRPPAKDLDTILMDMNVQDAEPLTPDQVNAKPRTQDMLYELFPRHIAEALKAGKKVEPESHELVTIVFSDIKGFTDISRDISPMKVSMMLDRLYLAFDKIARKHQVFKVETIGDAYMGVTNLVEKQEDTHVKLIAEFAVDMINEASQILIDEEEPSKGYISIRVGFHSGPVVSNVIGSLNPRYGLFGDTVNTASRMESNSSGSRILCSECSYMLLKRQAPEMPVKHRGSIHVKGKGDMSVYWIGDELITNNRRQHRRSQRAKAKASRSVRVVEPGETMVDVTETNRDDTEDGSPILPDHSALSEARSVMAGKGAEDGTLMVDVSGNLVEPKRASGTPDKEIVAAVNQVKEMLDKSNEDEFQEAFSDEPGLN